MALPITSQKGPLTFHEKVVCRALGRGISNAAQTYELTNLQVKFWLNMDNYHGSNALPKRISSLLKGCVTGWKVDDLGVRSVLEQVKAMPPRDRRCVDVAAAIYQIIDERMRVSNTTICGNGVARMHATKIKWVIHVVNVFVVRNETGTLTWYAVDKNTHSIAFRADSKCELLHTMRKFYNGVGSARSPREKKTGLFFGPGKPPDDWKNRREYPAWSSDDEEGQLVEVLEAGGIRTICQLTPREDEDTTSSESDYDAMRYVRDDPKEIVVSPLNT